MKGRIEREYVIFRDSEPVKYMMLGPDVVRRFCRRLSRRYPQYDWSVTQRFLAQGAD